MKLSWSGKAKLEFFITVSLGQSFLFLCAYVLRLAVRTARVGFKLKTEPTFSNARARELYLTTLVCEM